MENSLRQNNWGQHKEPQPTDLLLPSQSLNLGMNACEVI